MAPHPKKQTKQLDSAAKAELNRQGIEHWRRVGPLLEARRLEECEAMTAAERRRRHSGRCSDLCGIRAPHATTSAWSSTTGSSAG